MALGLLQIVTMFVNSKDSTGSKNNANKEKGSLKDKKLSLYSPASTNCQNSFKSVIVANLGIILKKSLLKKQEKPAKMKEKDENTSHFKRKRNYINKYPKRKSET